VVDHLKSRIPDGIVKDLESVEKNGLKRKRFNQCQLTALIVAYMIVSACTLKPTYRSPNFIPEDLPLSSKEARLGDKIYTDFRKKYNLSDDTERAAQLERIVGHLSLAAGSGCANWKVHLLDAPEIADVRAVPGNRIFVWSGLYDAIANEDELAGLLAYEIAHDLTRHTDPVRFNMMSKLLFRVGSLAGSTALMIASQGAVNLGGLDWMRLLNIAVRNLGPEERYYNHAEEQQAAKVALMMMQRSECRPEALVEFYWRALETHPETPLLTRLHRNLTPDQRLSMLENLWTDRQVRQPAKVPAPATIQPGCTPDLATSHPAYR
jgi:predicted Zn-dependent protease